MCQSFEFIKNGFFFKSSVREREVRDTFALKSIRKLEIDYYNKKKYNK